MNEQLKIFISVADNKSFNKAATELFISAPAVIKQINSLEHNIKVKLFNRTHNGVELTAAGKSFYEDAKKLIAAYNHSVSKAQNLSEKKEIVKIGAGPLATGIKTNNIWIEIGRSNSNLSFQFIPCSCSLGSFNEFLAGIGKEFDLVSSVYDQNLLEQYNLNALELEYSPLKLSVPINNPLISIDKLTLEDLNGQTVALPEQGKFQSFDKAREFLQQNSKIKIVTVPGIDMNVLNQCVKNNWILCSADDWQTAHSLLKAKNVEWSCAVPFGIVYGKQPKKVVKEIINYLKFDHPTD